MDHSSCFRDGEPIHCGAILDLQAIESLSDDYGEYHRPVQRGIRVRYELSFSATGSLAKRVVLHTKVDGHEFTSRLEGWMRFRWPSTHG